ncbi:unnamed protein product [Ceratitis capitata]|uniref:(Mediterranean fruit fly) hypothetical protein n=1 Tax=Ceratitis capitata TaxID=7213 RepID=A0A811UNC4_CERCA|nr:unnamed protein product [Ceratitis capitata]
MAAAAADCNASYFVFVISMLCSLPSRASSNICDVLPTRTHSNDGSWHFGGRRMPSSFALSSRVQCASIELLLLCSALHCIHNYIGAPIEILYDRRCNAAGAAVAWRGVYAASKSTQRSSMSAKSIDNGMLLSGRVINCDCFMIANVPPLRYSRPQVSQSASYNELASANASANI